MRNIFLIAIREYVENARTKGFWIGLFMLPFIIFLSAQVPILLQKKGKPTRHFVLIDASGEAEVAIEKALEQEYQKEVMRNLADYARANVASGEESVDGILKGLSDQSPDGVERFIEKGGAKFYIFALQPYLGEGSTTYDPPRRVYRRVEFKSTDPQDLPAIVEALKPYLRGTDRLEHHGEQVKLDAAILIPANIFTAATGAATSATNNARSVQYWSVNLADKSLISMVERTLSQELRRREYLTRGMDPTLYQEIEQSRVPVLELNPRKEEGKEKVDRGEAFAQWAPIGFVYLLWIAIFSISQMLLNNTIEEKSNRIIEVLLSSVTPAEFVFGKLWGIAAVGLTMVTAWLATLFGVVLWKSSSFGSPDIGNQIFSIITAPNLLLSFAVYFVFGYLLYAAIILSIGSVCNTLKESQN